MGCMYSSHAADIEPIIHAQGHACCPSWLRLIGQKSESEFWHTDDYPKIGNPERRFGDGEEFLDFPI